jgi:serine/threonine protein kinase
VEVGTVLSGKLRVERVLGRGGMGLVVVAKHLLLNQLVAVKVLRDELGHDRATVERFLREGQASVRLRSDHVCRVFDVGTLDSGAPYLVMELLDGADLATVIRGRPLAIVDAAMATGSPVATVSPMSTGAAVSPAPGSRRARPGTPKRPGVTSRVSSRSTSGRSSSSNAGCSAW